MGVLRHAAQETLFALIINELSLLVVVDILTGLIWMCSQQKDAINFSMQITA